METCRWLAVKFKLVICSWLCPFLFYRRSWPCLFYPYPCCLSAPTTLASLPPYVRVLRSCSPCFPPPPFVLLRLPVCLPWLYLLPSLRVVLPLLPYPVYSLACYPSGSLFSDFLLLVLFPGFFPCSLLLPGFDFSPYTFLFLLFMFRWILYLQCF